MPDDLDRVTPPQRSPKKPKYKPPAWIVYSRTIGLASLLVGGVAVTPAYFWWGVGCIYAGITLLAIDAYYEPWIRKWKILFKAILGAIGIAIYTVFTLTVVWVNAPLNVSPLIQSSEYRTGSVISGIPWSSRFSQLHMILENPTSMDYEDVDVLLRPDEAIAGIGQNGNIPNVSFIMNTSLTMQAEIRDFSSGARQGVQLTTLAFDGGYRVRCDKLPRNSQLDIVIAIGRPSGQKGFAINFSDGSHYWARSDISDEAKSLDDYFEPQRSPKSVRIDGKYNAAQRRRTVNLGLHISELFNQLKLPNKN